MSISIMRGPVTLLILLVYRVVALYYLPDRIDALMTFDRELYRVGDVARGECSLKDDYMRAASASSKNIRITGVGPNAASRIKVQIINSSTVRFHVDPLLLEDWSFSCYCDLNNGSWQLLESEKIVVGDKPTPLSEDAEIVVDDWNQGMIVRMFPDFAEQKKHCAPETLTDNRVVPRVEISWSPGETASFRKCSSNPEPMTCEVSASDFYSTNDFYLFNVTVWNELGHETKIYRLPPLVKPAAVTPSARAVNSRSALISWSYSSRNVRYNLTLAATNVQHKLTRTIDGVWTRGQSEGLDSVTVDGLVPHGDYRLVLTRIPIFPNGTERGYYSDAGDPVSLVMPDDVPALNPRVLHAIDATTTGQNLREVTLYVEPIDEKYTNGAVVVRYSLDGAAAQTLPEGKSALTLAGLREDVSYTVTVWAENKNASLGENKTLARTSMRIPARLDSDQLAVNVEANFINDGAGVNVTILGEMSDDLIYYVVYCAMDLSTKWCAHCPSSVQADQAWIRITLPPDARPNTYRVGVFARARAPRAALSPRSAGPERPAPDAHVRSFVWSPCLYNLSSAPDKTPVTVEPCVECLDVQYEEVQCDHTGAKIDSVIVKIRGSVNADRSITSSERIPLEPGHYTVYAQAVSQGGLGPEVTVSLRVKARDRLLEIITPVFVVIILIVSAVLISLYCVRKHKSRSKDYANRIPRPEVDEESADSPYQGEQCETAIASPGIDVNDTLRLEDLSSTVVYDELPPRSYVDTSGAPTNASSGDSGLSKMSSLGSAGSRAPDAPAGGLEEGERSASASRSTADTDTGTDSEISDDERGSDDDGCDSSDPFVGSSAGSFDGYRDLQPSV